MMLIISQARYLDKWAYIAWVFAAHFLPLRICASGTRWRWDVRHFSLSKGPQCISSSTWVKIVALEVLSFVCRPVWLLVAQKKYRCAHRPEGSCDHHCVSHTLSFALSFALSREGGFDSESTVKKSQCFCWNNGFLWSVKETIVKSCAIKLVRHTLKFKLREDPRIYMCIITK